MLYSLTIILTAVIAGFMLSYCITLGAYFNHLLQTRKDEGFSSYYAPFRKSKQAVFWYKLVCCTQIVMAILSCLFSSQTLFPKVIALVPFLLLFICHWLTVFGKSEEHIHSGLPIDDLHRSIYLKWNLPLHFFYFLTFFISALTQLILI